MNRYPGIRPFRSDERHLFFGRTDDTARLLRLILLEKVVILYGKSGYGKSSLLQAGVCPRLLETGELPFREIRLGPFQPGASPPAANVLYAVLTSATDREARAAGKTLGALDTLFPGDESLWLALKKRQFATGSARFLLIFDQFEELFTYPAEQIAGFKRELAEALYALVPDRFGRALSQNPGALSPEEQAVFYAPLELKVVFSIRADRMSQLNTLKDYLPNLLQHACLLDALDEKQATEAVTAPAALPQSPLSDREGPGVRLFDTPPFSYEPATLSLIFNELRDPETGKIETSALQIVCKHVEDNIGAGGGVVTPADLGDIKSIFRRFYDRTIASLPEREQPVARHLVEDLLIKDGVRLPFAAQALLAEPGVSPELLERLAAASLLRVERDEQGRMIYEVGHDTLVAPITEAAEVRREAEARAEERERLRLERAKIQRARRRNAAFTALALLLLGWALWQTLQAQKQAKVAEERTREAEAAERRAAEKDSLARRSQIEADTAKAVAERKTAEARRNAEANVLTMLQLGKSTEQVVDAIVKEANGHIYRLEYPEALGKLEAAAQFKKRTRDFDRAALELAFFFNESGQKQAGGPLAQALALLGKNLSNARNLSKLDPAWHKTLTEKYYSVMLDVPGGEYYPGCVKPGYCNITDSTYRAKVNNFRLARTETTFHQYGLFCAATGRDIFKECGPLGWGFNGDNPVVNVSWFDACLYANWLSRRFGLREVYDMGEATKGSYGDYYKNIRLDTAANGFRLPSEAEWEWAARGGPNATRTDAYSMTTYAGSDSLDLVGWYGENSGNRTHPVAGKQPNALGLFDMSGNVREWCWDWYADEYPHGPVAGWRGPGNGTRHVLRGGSWNYLNNDCQVSVRYRYDPDFRYFNSGFRLAQDSL